MLAISINQVTSTGFHGDGTALGLGLIIAATLSTLAIWTIKHEDMPASSSQKLKREAGSGDARLQLLMQMLDEDEKRQLKQRLLNDSHLDGELSLDELLAGQGGHWRSPD